MELLLIRHGETLPHSPDPYSHPLSDHGRDQARRVAEYCRSAGVRFLCASTRLRCQETADIITEEIGAALRWDLESLEDLSLDDLLYAPGATHHVNQWTAEQTAIGLDQLTRRVTGELARIYLYAQQQALTTIALVVSERVMRIILQEYADIPSEAIPSPIPATSICRLSLDGTTAQVSWIYLDPKGKT